MNSNGRHILIALALAFAARLAVYPFAGIEDPLFYEYGYIAEHLVKGEGYTLYHWLGGEVVKVPSAFMPPGQTFIIAAFFWAFGIGAVSYHLIFLLNALLGTASAFILSRITLQITGHPRMARVSLYAAALFPPFISASASWGVASTVLVLNGLLIYSGLLFSRSIVDQDSRLKRSIQFGTVAGILALFRAEAPLMIGFILLALLIQHRRAWLTNLKYLSLAGIIMWGLLSPWMIANYFRFDSVVLGSTSGGFNLWRGNNPTASGGGWRSDGSLVTPDSLLHSAIYEKLGTSPLHRWEKDYSAELAVRAITWINDNPTTFTYLALKKVLLLWVVDPYHYSNIKYIYAFFQCIAFGLGILGAASLRKSDFGEKLKSWYWIAGAACLSSTLITMVFFSLPRYQIFLVGIYFPIVAIGIDSLLSRSIRKRSEASEVIKEFSAS